MEATAASIAFIQFAGQIVTTIVKAHKLWEEIKDLPAELTDLIDDLKAFEPLFRGIEAQVNSQNVYFTGPNGSSAMASLECTRRAHKALEDMVKDMNKELSRKRGLKQKIAATKIIIKKDMLDKLEKRLQRALRLLETSLQLYQSILLQNHPEVIARKVTLELKQHLDSRDNLQQRVMISGQTVAARMQPQNLTRRIEFDEVEEVFDEPGKPQTTQRGLRYQERDFATVAKYGSPKAKVPRRIYGPSSFGRYAASYTKSTGEWEAYIQLPSWISETIYEFHYAPSLSGWMFNARIYNIVPNDSEIFRRVKQGDEAGVMELFQARKASPFDKDQRGQSLLLHATRVKQPAICKLLLQLGLHELLDEKSSNWGKSPLTQLMDQTSRWQRVDDPANQILQLFESYLQDPEYIPVERLFDMSGQYGQSSLRAFKTKFMKNYYNRPARDRFEAFRLGSFIEPSGSMLLEFLDEKGVISADDVRSSTRERISVLHSVAVALGRRLPDETIPHRRPPYFQYRIYHEYWAELVGKVALHCGSKDLHVLEEITPWDRDPVPVWRGTPLTSVIGGTLCYLAPDYPFYYWDVVFQASLQKWILQLQNAGVDLVSYGQEELRLLHDFDTGIKGAFDADAIRNSRTKLRKTLPASAELEQFSNRHVREHEMAKNDISWRPIRIIHLSFGPSVSDWHLDWAPEHEHHAKEFWQLFEEPETIMPGSWYED